MSNPLIELLGISYSVPERDVLFKDINLRLMEGDRLGLIGPNGSGKTTLMHLIVGIVSPDEGQVFINGSHMRTEKDFARGRRQVGILFQNADDQLFCPTVLEDVAFGPLNLGKSWDEAKTIARNTLKKLQLRGFEDRITSKLSGGEKKLVALATILSMEPKVLLLDEPTTGLDEETREHILTIINDLNLTSIIVSHNYNFLCRTSTSIYGIFDKTLHFEGESAAFHPHYHKHSMGNIPHNHT